MRYKVIRRGNRRIVGYLLNDVDYRFVLFSILRDYIYGISYPVLGISGIEKQGANY